uniref:rRNA methyltransferase 2, mitochondrial n=1 Tax=Strongyloides venezuelensis TaxID=75913 RepID=A0A0K0EYD4_STRVS
MTLLSLLRCTLIRTRNNETKKYLQRQFNDEFTRKAREHNYRARSVFKLMEMDQKYKLFNVGNVVVDVGCAPGSWSQYIVEKVNLNSNEGFVLGVDLKPMIPLKGATFLGQSDITKESTHIEIKKLINNRKVNAIVSDMAPNPCGDKRTDQIRLVNLCKELVFLFTKYEAISLDKNAIFLCKLWEGEPRKEFTQSLSKYFNNIKIVKPKASRDDSAELYVLGRDFKL